MIPNKMTVLRASYSPKMVELITAIGNRLAEAVIPDNGQYNWELDIEMPWVLCSQESFLVRQELENAGWRGIFRSKCAATEILKVYIPIRS